MKRTFLADSSLPLGAADARRPDIPLEAFLRVKRAERPDAAFWSEFEVEFKRRQLAASIAPRPWWLPVSLAWGRARPALLPMAGGLAAAVAAVAVVWWTPRAEQPLPGALAQRTPAGAGVPVVNVAGERSAGSGAGVADFVAPQQATEVSVAQRLVVEVAKAEDAAVAMSIAESDVVSRVDLLARATENGSASAAVEPAASAARAAEVTGFALAMAQVPAVTDEWGAVADVDLGYLHTHAPGLVAASLGGAAFDASAFAALARAEMTELPVVLDFGLDERQARLIAQAAEHEAAPAPGGSSAARPRDQGSRRLDDDQLYAAASRLGYSGQSVSFRF
jgi:hypothetical protein